MQFKKCITKKSFSNIFKFLTILSMVLNFNFKEAQAKKQNNIADKNIETLNEKKSKKRTTYMAKLLF